jgi:hypothetical protein
LSDNPTPAKRRPEIHVQQIRGTTLFRYAVLDAVGKVLIASPPRYPDRRQALAAAQELGRAVVSAANATPSAIIVDPVPVALERPPASPFADVVDSPPARVGGRA